MPLTNRWQLLPAGVALAVTCGAIILTGPGVARFGDAQDYMAAATSLLAGHGYPRESSLPFFRPPLYPAFIATVWAVAPGGPAAVKFAQAVLFALTCWLLYRIGVRVTADRLASVIGATLYGVYPLAVLPVTEVQTESLHTALVAGGVFALTRVVLDITPNRWAALLAGLAFGLAALCRPTALPVGLTLALATAFIPSARPFRDRVWLSALVAVGIGAGVAPWTATNWRATGEWIVVTDGGGYHLWLGNHPAELRIYEGDFRSKQEFDAYAFGYLQDTLVREQIAEWERAGGYRALSLKGREQLWYEEFRKNLREQPTATAKLAAYKTWSYWRPWLLPGAYPRTVVVGSGVLVCGLYSAATCGFWLLARDRHSRPWLLLIATLFVASTGVHTLTHVMVRFRVPYVDPYLFLAAGALLACSWRWVRTNFIDSTHTPDGTA